MNGRTVHGYAPMIGMGTLHFDGGGVCEKAENAADGAVAVAALTGLAVLTYSFTEGHRATTCEVTGGFEEGRVLAGQEARDLLASGYAKQVFRPCKFGTRVSTCYHMPRCGPKTPGSRGGPFGRWEDKEADAMTDNMWAGTGRARDIRDVKTLDDAREAGAEIIQSCWAHGFTREIHESALNRLLDRVWAIGAGRGVTVAVRQDGTDWRGAVEHGARRFAEQPAAGMSAAMAAACTCHHACAEDPKTRCSLSGRWHVHPGDPCPVHPDAPGDR